MSPKPMLDDDYEGVVPASFAGLAKWMYSHGWTFGDEAEWGEVSRTLWSRSRNTIPFFTREVSATVQLNEWTVGLRWMRDQYLYRHSSQESATQRKVHIYSLCLGPVNLHYTYEQG